MSSPTLHEDADGHLARLLSDDVIEPVDTGQKRVRYRLTDSARARAGAFAKVARIEHPERFSSDALDVADAVAAIHIALPRVRLPSGVAGICSLNVQPDPYMPPEGRELFVEIEGGRPISISTAVTGATSHAKIEGKTSHWLVALMDGYHSFLCTTGDRWIVRGLLAELHRRTFVAPSRETRAKTVSRLLSKNGRSR